MASAPSKRPAQQQEAIPPVEEILPNEVPWQMNTQLMFHALCHEYMHRYSSHLLWQCARSRGHWGQCNTEQQDFLISSWTQFRSTWCNHPLAFQWFDRKTCEQILMFVDSELGRIPNARRQTMFEPPDLPTCTARGFVEVKNAALILWSCLPVPFRSRIVWLIYKRQCIEAIELVDIDKYSFAPDVQTLLTDQYIAGFDQFDLRSPKAGYHELISSIILRQFVHAYSCWSIATPEHVNLIRLFDNYIDVYLTPLKPFINLACQRIQNIFFSNRCGVAYDSVRDFYQTHCTRRQDASSTHNWRLSHQTRMSIWDECRYRDSRICPIVMLNTALYLLERDRFNEIMFPELSLDDYKRIGCTNPEPKRIRAPPVAPAAPVGVLRPLSSYASAPQAIPPPPECIPAAPLGHPLCEVEELMKAPSAVPAPTGSLPLRSLPTPEIQEQKPVPDDIQPFNQPSRPTTPRASGSTPPQESSINVQQEEQAAAHDQPQVEMSTSEDFSDGKEEMRSSSGGNDGSSSGSGSARTDEPRTAHVAHARVLPIQVERRTPAQVKAAHGKTISTTAISFNLHDLYLLLVDKFLLTTYYGEWNIGIGTVYRRFAIKMYDLGDAHWFKKTVQHRIVGSGQKKRSRSQETKQLQKGLDCIEHLRNQAGYWYSLPKDSDDDTTLRKSMHRWITAWTPSLTKKYVPLSHANWIDSLLLSVGGEIWNWLHSQLVNHVRETSGLLKPVNAIFVIAKLAVAVEQHKKLGNRRQEILNENDDLIQDIRYLAKLVALLVVHTHPANRSVELHNEYERYVQIVIKPIWRETITRPRIQYIQMIITLYAVQLVITRRVTNDTATLPDTQVRIRKLVFQSPLLMGASPKRLLRNRFSQSSSSEGPAILRSPPIEPTKREIKRWAAVTQRMKEGHLLGVAAYQACAARKAASAVQSEVDDSDDDDNDDQSIRAAQSSPSSQSDVPPRYKKTAAKSIPLLSSHSSSSVSSSSAAAAAAAAATAAVAAHAAVAAAASSISQASMSSSIVVDQQSTSIASAAPSLSISTCANTAQTTSSAADPEINIRTSDLLLNEGDRLALAELNLLLDEGQAITAMDMLSQSSSLRSTSGWSTSFPSSTSSISSSSSSLRSTSGWSTSFPSSLSSTSSISSLCSSTASSSSGSSSTLSSSRLTAHARSAFHAYGTGFMERLRARAPGMNITQSEQDEVFRDNSVVMELLTARRQDAQRRQ